MSKKLVVFAPGLVVSSFGLVVSMQTYSAPEQVSQLLKIIIESFLSSKRE